MPVYRWAVNCCGWKPSRQEWLSALSLVQSEERERVTKFVFERDAKLALVGRLLLRAVLCEALEVGSQTLRLGRSWRGKPLLEEPVGQRAELHFNLSHQGSFTVLAAQTGCQVGVDVMQFTRPRGEGMAGFFYTMRRQFTAAEWSQIRPPQLEQQQQLSNFYRFWCLKESFIKAEGSGLAYGLQNLDFTAAPGWPPQSGGVVEGSTLAVGGQEATEWHFEESLLDNEHCVCVASKEKPEAVQNFSLKLVPDLMSQLTPPPLNQAIS